MHILLTGADGFIGSALVEALQGRGHSLTLCVRDVDGASQRWPQHRVIAVDFSIDHTAEDWVRRLAGVDAVVNAVGIFQERGDQTFADLHVRAPVALFEACVAAGVDRVVQISALGAGVDAPSGFQRSKHQADVALGRLPVRSTIVRPSLVFAPTGASARWFLQLAALPLVPLPGRGEQCVQPIHRDDLVAAIVTVLESAQPPALLEAVGPQPLPLRDYLAGLRRTMGLGRVRFVRVPMTLVRMASGVGSYLSGGLFDRSALQMLERGNCADAVGISDVLGRPPRSVDRFVEPERMPIVRQWARLQSLLPILRCSIALVWIVTGFVSLGLYPVSDSLALLARVGLYGGGALTALFVAAWLDIALGLATLFSRRRRWLYVAQAVVIVAYTALITLWLPEFWLHPYGPVLKNLPLLAALWLLHALDEGPR